MYSGRYLVQKSGLINSNTIQKEVRPEGVITDGHELYLRLTSVNGELLFFNPKPAGSKDSVENHHKNNELKARIPRANPYSAAATTTTTALQNPHPPHRPFQTRSIHFHHQSPQLQQSHQQTLFSQRLGH